MEVKVIDDLDGNDEIKLKDLVLNIRKCFRYLLRKWAFIVIFGILGSGVGLAYSYYKKVVYKATTTFVLEESDKGGGLGQYSGLASMVGVDIGGSGGSIFQGDNILELYKSRTMIEKTLLTEVEYNGKKELLVNRYINLNKLREKWAGNSTLKLINFNKIGNSSTLSLDFKRLQDSILGTIVADINKNYLSVTKPDKKLSIIYAEVRSNDEFFAKTFDEEIVKNVNDFYVQTKTKKSVQNIAILQIKVDSVRSVLNGSIYTAATVADATPNLNITRQAQRIVPVQRSQFATETNKAILGELLKNLEISKISLLKEAPLIQIIDKPVLPLEIDRLGKLKGMIIGGFLAVFFTMILILSKKILQVLMA